MQHNLVYTMMALLIVVGVGMFLSFTAGGVTFGIGCFAAALTLWLLYRGVMALEMSADLLATNLLQRDKTTARDDADARDHAEAVARSSETVVEEPRPSQPVVAGD